MSLSRKNDAITRRTILRGVGAAVALPLLEVMKPVAALGAGADAAAGAVRGAKAAAPVRMAFLYVANGKNMAHWTPKGEGPLADLPDTLKPLDRHKDQLLVLSNLAQHNGQALGDGPGDHARALASFLTGAHPRKTDGADIRAGVSVDQFAAQRVGYATRFASLELGIDRGAQSGNCDSGYSCAYSSNISWSSPTTPVAKEIDPRQVFDRLFGDAQDPNKRVRDKYNQSVLDFALDDAKRLHRRLGVADQRKLDEYLTSVRDIERRISRTDVVKPPKDFRRPDQPPADVTEHIHLMADLLVLAFQTDQTRISTFMLTNDSSNRSYPMIGVNDGHHDLSHHQSNSEKLAKIQKIDAYHIEQVAYFLDRLKSVKEGEKTLLDNMMIVYGSGIGDGNRHNHNNLPILFAGGAGGAVKPGRHVNFSSETPLNNLYLWMLDRMGVNVPSFGDSKGKLARLDG